MMEIRKLHSTVSLTALTKVTSYFLVDDQNLMTIHQILGLALPIQYLRLS
jgi:hypothetical protein